MESEAEPTAGPELPWATAAYQRLLNLLPQSRRGKLLLAILVGGFVMGLSIGMLILPIWVDLSEERFATFGYSGVFLANLASTATVFIPVPGLTAIGQALILQQGAILNPVYVGLLGGTGMALGEVTAYVAGSVGSGVVADENIRAPKRVRRLVERVIRWVDWLMKHYGFITLLVLSAIPNPTFELAGITAGASRMNFWRFMLAVLIGKNIRGLALAFAGANGVSVPFLT
ncbi:MAG: VTT domain-containing protein [Chloroflexi bacterium]|nr:VTT domain-containing protein [Chloroflexota bacterium]